MLEPNSGSFSDWAQALAQFSVGIWPIGSALAVRFASPTSFRRWLSPVGFAICQALAAYGMSLLFDHTGGDYRILFGVGAGSLLLALAIDLVAGLVRPRDFNDA